jgi:2-polyprenyl-3-methyl-5-hydroxy-6-metoxy-1,4-benzoquinol methylase
VTDLPAEFDSRWLRGYVRGKLASDPVYEAVFSRLPDLPLLDLGCGIGLLPLYLRSRGFRAEISGIDHDHKKIASAPELPHVSLRVGDVREALDFRGSVTLIDVLHYFTTGEQQQILRNVAACIAPGGVAIIRDAPNDGSWRYRATYIEERFARAIGWLRGERLNFPTRETIMSAFDGFAPEVVPMWGRTPFNGYLFAFRSSRA